jgi:hypothetical protein
MISRRFLQAAVLALVIAALPVILFYSCDDNPTETDDYTTFNITKVSGDNQTERVGAQLPEPLFVQVENLLGDEQQGIEVEFITTDPGAEVIPESAITGSDGRAFCRFVLGSVVGPQSVKAVIETDSTTFAATAIEVPCTEADPSPSSDWSSNKVYYVTTSSAMITTGNSVLVEFDPDTDTRTKILETEYILTDVAFSSRGELFVASSEYLYKVNATTKQPEEYTDLSMSGHVEIDANKGGILAGLSVNGPFEVECTPAAPVELYPDFTFVGMRAENFTADPVSRDLFFISGSTPTFKLYRVPWDGSADVGGTMSLVADLNIGDNTPRGMCIDYSGNLYVTVDGTDNYRRIIKVFADGTVDYEFFDFYSYFGSLEAGRWGDITLPYGNSLYLIDTEENRIVEITTSGEYVREVNSTDFSGPGTPGETYGITAMLQPPETAP